MKKNIFHHDMSCEEKQGSFFLGSNIALQQHDPVHTKKYVYAYHPEKND